MHSRFFVKSNVSYIAMHHRVRTVFICTLSHRHIETEQSGSAFRKKNLFYVCSVIIYPVGRFKIYVCIICRTYSCVCNVVGKRERNPRPCFIGKNCCRFIIQCTIRRNFYRFSVISISCYPNVKFCISAGNQRVILVNRDSRYGSDNCAVRICRSVTYCVARIISRKIQAGAVCKYPFIV